METKDIKPIVQVNTNPTTNDIFKQVERDTFLDKSRQLTVENTAAPTYTPKSFQEQIYFQVGGFVWMYISGTWVKVNPTVTTHFKNGQVAVPATGASTTITGIGFRSKLIKVTATYDSKTTLGTMSVGSYDGTNHKYSYVSGGYSGSGVDQLVYMWDGSNTATRCTVSALSDDGFTITSANNSVATTITYECFG